VRHALRAYPPPGSCGHIRGLYHSRAQMNPDVLVTMIAVLLGCVISGALGFILGR